MNTQDINCTIVISYVPLFYTPPTTFVDVISENNLEKLKPIIDKIENIDNAAEGVGWTHTAEPIFIMDDAEEIARHIEYWSEGMPKDWFTVNWMEKDDKYAIVLMPDLNKSVKRHREIWKIQTGTNLPKNTSHKILFKPIIFISGSNQTFKQIKDKIPKRVRVGFSSDKTLSTDPYFLGNGQKFDFEYSNNDYMKSLFEE